MCSSTTYLKVDILVKELTHEEKRPALAFLEMWAELLGH